jgi:GNAT superfamily N-acetyltransferase
MSAAIVSFLDSEHIDSVAPLFQAQLREHGISTSLESVLAVVRHVLTHPSHGFVLFASFNGVPIGVAYVACLLSLEHGGNSGWLEEFYVLPEWRNRGFGSQLLARALSTATDRGWRAIDLEFDFTHERVVSLYTRSHFEPVRRNRFVRRLGNKSNA